MLILRDAFCAARILLHDDHLFITMYYITLLILRQLIKAHINKQWHWH